MIAAHLLGEKALGLKALAFGRLSIEMTPISDLIGKGKNQLTFDRVDLVAACEDVDAYFQSEMATETSVIFPGRRLFTGNRAVYAFNPVCQKDPHHVS